MFWYFTSGDTKFLFLCSRIFHSFAALTREIFFQHSRRNFVSPRGHEISSNYYSFKILAPIPRLIPHNPLALTIFGRRQQYTINLYSQTFTQLNRDCHLLILGHMALTKIKCIPIYFSRIVPSSGFITARDQSMVESGETEGRKNAASFLCRE